MTEQLNLKVTGMTGAGCEQRITTALDEVLEVDGDGEVVRGAIDGLGYRVVP